MCISMVSSSLDDWRIFKGKVVRVLPFGAFRAASERKDTLRQVFDEMGVDATLPISFSSFFQAEGRKQKHVHERNGWAEKMFGLAGLSGMICKIFLNPNSIILDAHPSKYMNSKKRRRMPVYMIICCFGPSCGNWKHVFTKL